MEDGLRKERICTGSSGKKTFIVAQVVEKRWMQNDFGSKINGI